MLTHIDASGTRGYANPRRSHNEHVNERFRPRAKKPTLRISAPRAGWRAGDRDLARKTDRSPVGRQEPRRGRGSGGGSHRTVERAAVGNQAAPARQAQRIRPPGSIEARQQDSGRDRPRDTGLILYLDTSAFLKLYLSESGSAEVKQAIAEAAAIYTHLIAYAEMRAGLTRASRERRLSESELAYQVSRFEDDWESLGIIAVTEPLVRRAGALAERFGLRGYDSVHLAAAEQVFTEVASETRFRFAVFFRHELDRSRPRAQHSRARLVAFYFLCANTYRMQRPLIHTGLEAPAPNFT